MNAITKCSYGCGAYFPFYMNNFVCKDCKQIQVKKLAASIKKIMHDQMLLFQGFMRREMGSNDIPNEILNICNQFFILPLQYLLTERKGELLNHGTLKSNQVEGDEMDICALFVTQSTDNKEYYIAYRVSQMLIEILPKRERIQARYRNQLKIIETHFNSS